MKQLIVAILAVTAFACGSEPPAPAPAQSTAPEAAPVAAHAEVRYAQVDGLKVRAHPKRGAEVVATLNESEPVELTDETPQNKELIALRGTLYQRPWHHVRLPDGTAGWAYGGGLGSTDGKAGRRNTDTELDFPYFGRYDLAKWEKVSEIKPEDGGEMDLVTTTYRLDNRQMDVTTSSMGDYGYSYNYVLSDIDGTVQLTRDFTYTLNFGAERMLEETIVNHLEGEPETRFRRLMLPNDFQFADHAVRTFDPEIPFQILPEGETQDPNSKDPNQL